MKRILLCRTDAIGDLILTLPVARSIKEAYPELHITMLVSEYTEPLLQAEEYIDGVMTIPGRELASYVEVRELSQMLKVGSFDAVVFFYPRFSLVLATFMARAARRIGSSYRIYSLFLNERVKLHRKHSGKHELDLNYDLVESALPGLRRREPHLTVPHSEITSAESFLAQKGIAPGEPYIVVHPFSRGSAPNWRLDRYLHLVQQLVEAGRKIVVTGSIADRDSVSHLQREEAPNIVWLMGETDLRRLLAIIKVATLVVTSSTGPIHMAASVGTFAIGIYPPIAALSPTRWGPRGAANRLFVPDADPNNKGAAELMDGIKVETVLAFILAKL